MFATAAAQRPDTARQPRAQAAGRKQRSDTCRENLSSGEITGNAQNRGSEKDAHPLHISILLNRKDRQIRRLKEEVRSGKDI